MAKEKEKKTWKITLADGTQLAGLGLNGNNFVTPVKVTKETFNGKLSRVIIEGDESEDGYGLIGEHKNMELVQITPAAQGEGYWFVLRDLSEAELEKILVNSRLDYIEMMEEL